eukprot:2915072-Rhodomonas_salina.2
MAALGSRHGSEVSRDGCVCFPTANGSAALVSASAWHRCPRPPSAEENRPVLGAGRGRVILIRGSVQRLRGAQLSKGLEGGTKGMRGRWEERETLERYMG